MKRYRNATGSILVVDCTSYTKYLKPGEIAALPNSRDVRYNARLRKLILVSTENDRKKKPKHRKRYPKHATNKSSVKSKKRKQKKETMEINNGVES